jgi:histidinol-phosphate aminotransferase
MPKIQPQPGIMDIKLYQAGSSHAIGAENTVKLSSNENPFGPSPAAIEALCKTAHMLHRYPSTDHLPLRTAIAEAFDLCCDNIICGVGSDEIISFLCYAYAGPGDEVIHTEHGFAMYRISALAAGATPVEVPEHRRMTDVDAILAACNERTKIVFIANPNNPTGTMIGEAEVSRLIEGIPSHTILVLDGAYAEYVEGYDGGASLVHSHENIVMTRTFSKLYGLGGLRVGWGYGSKQIINTLNRIRGPFNVSLPALAAAEAAVKDQAYADKCRNENTRLRVWLANALAEHGVVSDTSMTNFILARFNSQEEAEACDDYMQSQGLIVRRVGGYNLPECLRITVGDEASCRRVADAVGQFKGHKND